MGLQRMAIGWQHGWDRRRRRHGRRWLKRQAARAMRRWGKADPEDAPRRLPALGRWWY